MSRGRVVLAGGSGQIGRLLAHHYLRQARDVVVLTRSPSATPGGGWREVAWDGCTIGDWQSELDGASLLVNLAGRTVDCRYNESNLRQMLDSRVDSTRVLGEVISASRQPVPVWLQSSTATIYKDSYDRANDESTGRIAEEPIDLEAPWQYSVHIAKEWERVCGEAPTPATRKVLLRSAMVMTPDRGGIFDVLLGLVRKGLGGTASHGRQYVSWIHGDDFVRVLDLLESEVAWSGPVNLAAPEPLPNREFMAALRGAAGVPIGLPAARWMLEVGAVFLRTETELLLKSRRVVPGRLLESGFEFDFESWPDAARDLHGRWRSGSTN